MLDFQSAVFNPLSLDGGCLVIGYRPKLVEMFVFGSQINTSSKETGIDKNIQLLKFFH